MEALLKKIDQFIAKHGISETYFGNQAVSDSNFVSRLRKGGQCLPRTEGKVVKFMKDYPDRKKAKRVSA